MNTKQSPLELRSAALSWLCETHADQKGSGVLALKNQTLSIDTEISLTPDAAIPGRPSKPKLIPPGKLKKRSMRTQDGRAALIHALAHIEFNAINLALDAIWRFANMPAQYYTDWLKVAVEEAYHFTLLRDHLKSLGYAYGDFDGHNSLWEMVEKTQDDVLARMALVPRTMEARGLDANLPLRNKIVQAGDLKAGDILDIILRDEIGHVAIGNHWYHYICQARKIDSITTFDALCTAYQAPKMRPPFNMEARKKAGFTEEELTILVDASQQTTLSRQ